jgi:hypothetical protein
MAKATKKTDKTDGKTEMLDKGGAGTKHCPQCKKFFKGPTRMECPGCGYKFPASTKTSTRGATGQGLGGMLTSVSKYIEECGGIKKADERLRAVDTLVRQTGSIPNAIRALEDLQRIAPILVATPVLEITGEVKDGKKK